MQPINYSPMENFNNVFANQMNQVADNTMMLKGGVETTVMPDIKNDAQLKNDMTILTGEGAGKVAGDFKSALTNSLNELNATERNADAAVETFATGGDIDVHSVMIATQKASLSMQMAMQLRNKAMQAYSEIAKMSI